MALLVGGFFFFNVLMVFQRPHSWDIREKKNLIQTPLDLILLLGDERN